MLITFQPICSKYRRLAFVAPFLVAVNLPLPTAFKKCNGPSNSIAIIRSGQAKSTASIPLERELSGETSHSWWKPISCNSCETCLEERDTLSSTVFRTNSIFLAILSGICGNLTRSASANICVWASCHSASSMNSSPVINNSIALTQSFASKAYESLLLPKTAMA